MRYPVSRVVDLIDIDTAAPVYETPAGVEIYQYENFGEALTTGVDAQAKVKAEHQAGH